MIGYWHNPVVCPSVWPFVRLSVCDTVHCGTQGWCTGLNCQTLYQRVSTMHVPICPLRHFCSKMYLLATKCTTKTSRRSVSILTRRRHAITHCWQLQIIDSMDFGHRAREDFVFAVFKNDRLLRDPILPSQTFVSLNFYLNHQFQVCQTFMDIWLCTWFGSYNTDMFSQAETKQSQWIASKTDIVQ